MGHDEARENKLRNLAERQGLALQQSDQDDPEADDFAKYRIVTPGDNSAIVGDDPYDFSLTLDDVEEWLTNDESTAQADTVSSPHETRKASRDSETHTEE